MKKRRHITEAHVFLNYLSVF